jgi:hypothetical protein
MHMNAKVVYLHPQNDFAQLKDGVSIEFQILLRDSKGAMGLGRSKDMSVNV